MLKNILFTHDDLDGLGCRVIYEIAHFVDDQDSYSEDKKSWMVTNCSNKSISMMVESSIEKGFIGPETHVMFADISPDRPALERVLAVAKTVDICDHHETAFWTEDILGKDHAHIIPINDMGIMESGTSILFKWFLERGNQLINECNEASFLGLFVDTVRSYDTYEWKETNNLLAKQLQTLFILLGMETMSHRYLGKILSKDDGPLIDVHDMEFVEARLNREQRVIDNFIENSEHNVIPLDICGFKAVFTVNVSFVGVSELAYQFLIKHPEIDCFISYDLGTNAFSFRSAKDGVNTSQRLALPLGGGGHPRASGACLGEEFKNTMVDHVLQYLEEKFAEK